MKHYAVLLSGLVIAARCSPVLYSTVGQNVPLFHEKGETSLSGGYAQTPATSGPNIQLATAVDSAFLIMGSFYSFKTDPGDGNTDYWTSKITYIEAGAGKFAYRPSGFVCELVGGLGYGSVKNERGVSTIQTQFIKPFFQPSIGFSLKNVEIALTTRLAYMNYFGEEIVLQDPAERQDVMGFFDAKNSTFVFEPGLTLRLGLRRVKLQAQYNYTTFSYDQYPELAVNKTFFSLNLFVLTSGKRGR